MVKIALDAGHGMKTAGKRTPDDEKEWSFNDMVVRYAIVGLKAYENVEVLRVDDLTGLTDAPLAARVNQANGFKADAYISVHHNAFKGVWGNHTGTETFIFPDSSKSRKLAEAIHPQVVKKFKLTDRGIKEANFQVLRDTKMVSVLIEGGYMDSTIDIVALRDESRLKAQAEGIVLGLANYFGLKKKEVVKVTQVSKPVASKTVTDTKGIYRIKTGTFKNASALADAVNKIKSDFGFVVHEAADTTSFNSDYRIYTGTFTTKEAAEDARAKIKAKYGWITYLIDETK